MRVALDRYVKTSNTDEFKGEVFPMVLRYGWTIMILVFCFFSMIIFFFYFSCKCLCACCNCGKKKIIPSGMKAKK